MIGICHLCGKEKELTYEHVPQKGANNSKRVQLITGKEIFNSEKIYTGQPLNYINQQKGAGGYTLCKECNNNTGNWYAKEYNKFANVIGYVMTNEVDFNKVKAIQFCGDNLHFQRIIKQILCMFLSTIQPWKLKNFKDIQEYVMNKNEINFNKEKICERCIYVLYSDCKEVNC